MQAQAFHSYEKPFKKVLFSSDLQDSVHLEITLPKELGNQPEVEYPVIYLLDKQLRNNYTYNLQTIDYLSTLQRMPESIVVGISFDRKNRNPWTIPNASGGKADELISFLAGELNDALKADYPIAQFNLLIGHSRTAIFSSYALSKRFDFFNAIVANSVSNFDFGSKLQKSQFELFLSTIDTSSHNYYYHFSVGESEYGDAHEIYVDSLNEYFTKSNLPEKFVSQYHKFSASHDVTPGLATAMSLNAIFKSYGVRVRRCFQIAKQFHEEVPWDAYMEVYETLSKELGYSVRPSQLFFNSIASEYYFDTNKIYENNLQFALEVLLKAIETYPKDYGYLSWIAEIYIAQKDYDQAGKYLNQSVDLINKDKSISESDRIALVEEVEELRKLIK